jgi:hypothetical protein
MVTWLVVIHPASVARRSAQPVEPGLFVPSGDECPLETPQTPRWRTRDLAGWFVQVDDRPDWQSRGAMTWICRLTL